ncbi:MAG: hypothetical protein ACRYHQ_24465 [Janthinobacterium lividum]
MTAPAPIPNPHGGMARVHAWMALLYAFVSGMAATATAELAMREGYPRLLLLYLTVAMAGFAVFSTSMGRMR